MYLQAYASHCCACTDNSIFFFILVKVVLHSAQTHTHRTPFIDTIVIEGGGDEDDDDDSVLLSYHAI